MNILICSERLLFRFGLDRVLIRLGQGFFERGNHVTVMANHFDRKVVERFAERIIEAPLVAADHLHVNEAIAAWLDRTWDTLFTAHNRPDAVLVGGWPFFEAIPVLRQRVGCVVFEDVGAVPLDGYTGANYATQIKLRALRRRHLREATSIAVISDFLARTQSIPDTDGSVPISRIHMAADHVDQPDWGAGDVDAPCAAGAALTRANTLKAEGRRLILNLGRWEPGCYKNSEAAYDVMMRLTQAQPDATLLVLAERSAVNIPAGLQGIIEPVGHPDDHELKALMSACEFGISVSRWEGFNLPIVEMHWARRAALALDLAAHPEIIGDPWYLCRDMADMSDKAAALLAGRGPDAAAQERVFRRCRTEFRWQRVVDEHLTLLSEGHFKARAARTSNQVIFLDVTNSTVDLGNPGIVRVTRQLGQTLQSFARVYFVVWDPLRMAYVFPTEAEAQVLARYNGPILGRDHPRSKDKMTRIEMESVFERHQDVVPWLLVVEIRSAADQGIIHAYLRSLLKPMRAAAIFHDAIPVLRPDLCSPAISAEHPGYMRGLAQFDQVFAVSEYSRACVERFWRDSDVAPAPARTLVNPGEFGGGARVVSPKEWSGKTVDILCVSTLEARKNHRTLIDAFIRVKTRRPEIAFSLTLVGNQYRGAEDIADWIVEQSRRHPEIRWLGIVDDAELHKLYERSAFTVYPSIIEGFGLPIMESLWHARPCICHDQGAMGELIGPGGGLAVNVRDAAALADAIERLATDARLYNALARQAAARTIKTWHDYAKELLMALTDRTLGADLAARPASRWQTDPSNILYPNCLLENWQMTDSERLAMTALLQRIEPRVAIEIGTFKGGSLSLLSQYAEMVFSLDIDPALSERLGYFENVSFLTGDSHVVLPALLAELDEKGLYPDFLLIDGDHSVEGIKRDVAAVLKYVPKKPLFVLLHDSFNPDCRRGMLESAWERCPYVHHVNLDFVPGRIMETGDFLGELCGGLALAYFLPTPRNGELGPIISADGMFRIVQRAAVA